MNQLQQRLKDTLHKHEVKCTSARLAVFTALSEAHEPLALQEVVKRVNGADRASVYRTLELFEKLRIVDTVLIGWKKRFELAAPFKNHHHHIYCEPCGKVVSIDSPSLERIIKTISEQKGFRLRQHTLELSGICRECEQEQASGPQAALPRP